MKHLRLFETETDYDSEVSDFEYPTVSHVQDVDDVRYMGKPDYKTKYLSLEPLESGTFTLTVPANVNSSYMTSVSYSTDNGKTWTTTQIDNTAQTITTPVINNGSKVLWKGIGTRLSAGDSKANSSYFSSTSDFNCSGNIMSLLFGDDFISQTTIGEYAFAYLFTESRVVDCTLLMLPATTIGQYCYKNMFYYCTKLVKSIQLLPANNLPRRCYAYMFRDCTSLVDGLQEISATKHSSTAACHSMFRGCTALVTAPRLPATSLQGYSYMDMFNGCSSLTTAPDLPAITLYQQTYCYMFNRCSKLNYIKAMFTSTPATSETGTNYQYLFGVAATGTFVKNRAAQWNVTGSSGVPSGWTIILADA